MDATAKSELLERMPWLRLRSDDELEDAADMLAELDLVTEIDVPIARAMSYVMERLDPDLGEEERWNIHMALRAIFIHGMTAQLLEDAKDAE